MSQTLQIKLEIENKKSNALLVGQYSVVGQALKELLTIRGLSVNESLENEYLFQLDEFEKAEFFLAKAEKSGAKYYLIYNLDAEDKAGEKAFKIVSQKILAKKINGKIIQYSGFKGNELELCRQILNNCFRQTKEETIILKEPGKFFPEEAGQNFEGQNKPKKKSWRYFLFFLFALFILTLPLTFILTNLLVGSWSLNQSYRLALNSNFLQAKIAAFGSEQNFKNALLATKLFSGFLETGEFARFLKAGENLSLGAGHLAEAAEEGQKLGASILGQKASDINADLTNIKLSISLAEEELAKAEAQKINLPFLQPQLAKAVSLRQKLTKIKNFLPNFPWLLGFDNPRTYLVLLQNNFELRPGGGFIGTIGFLTFNEGKMEFKIQDVYAVDGQLTGHVDPPGPIKNYLHQPHWYLRDSNFSPDFTVNAEKALWFLQKELGVSLDGVIGMDLSLLQKILGATGPLDVLDYNEKITGENFFFKTQAHINDSFFPGSTVKKDFLGATAEALFNKLTSKNLPYLQLARVISSAFDERHLLLFWQNPVAEEVTLRQGWGGEVRSNVAMEQCNNGAMCANDYLMVVDANLGVNKVNYFVKRKIKKEVELDQNELSSKATINYENASPAGINFGGAYKNYLRVLTDKDWTLENITVDGKNLNLTRDVDKEEIDNKQSTGLLIEVPALGKKEITFVYKRSLVKTGGQFIYDLLIQKQAGTDKDSLVIASNFGLSYNGDLLVDRMFQVRLK